MSSTEQFSRSLPIIHSGEWRSRFLLNKWIQRAVVWGSLIILYELSALGAGEFFLPRVSQILVGSIELVQEGWASTLVGSLNQMLLGFSLAIAVV